MANSLNVKFTATATPHPEHDHPKGAGLAGALEHELRLVKWKTTPMESWHDRGWLLGCHDAGGEFEISLVNAGTDRTWLVELTPAMVPGFLAKLFGGKPSASADDLLRLGRVVHRLLREKMNASEIMWRWNVAPTPSNSTREPAAFR